MKTLKEKLEAKFDEGLEAARTLIRSKTGESQMLCDPSSPYYLDLRDRARMLEARLDEVGLDINEFVSLSGWFAGNSSDGEQIDLSVDPTENKGTIVGVEIPALPPPEPPGRVAGEPAKRGNKKKATWRDRYPHPDQTIAAFLADSGLEEICMRINDEQSEVEFTLKDEKLVLPTGGALSILEKGGADGWPTWRDMKSAHASIINGSQRWDDNKNRWVKKRKKAKKD